jgi:hypothetical protein
MFMKALLVVTAFGIIAATPAFARPSLTACHQRHTPHQQRLPAAPHMPNFYYQPFPHIWTG